MIYFLAVLVWAALAVVMLLNGIFRELALRPWLGFLGSQALSSLVGAALILASAVWMTRKKPDAPQKAWWRVGLLWGGLTLTSETVLGRFVAGIPWELMLQNYNLAAGRFWPLVLLATFLAPPLAARYLSGRPRTRRR